MQCVENCDDHDVSKHVLYEQPVWQSMNMFVGELGVCTSCFITHQTSGRWCTRLLPHSDSVFLWCSPNSASFPSFWRSCGRAYFAQRYPPVLYTMRLLSILQSLVAFSCVGSRSSFCGFRRYVTFLEQRSAMLFTAFSECKADPAMTARYTTPLSFADNRMTAYVPNHAYRLRDE